MRYLFLIFSAMLSGSMAAQEASRPSYQDVATYYFSHYIEPEEGDEGWRLQFSRQPDGYYAQVVSYVERPAAVELFYDFGAGAYRTLSDKFERRAATSGSEEEKKAETIRLVENHVAQNGHHIVEFDLLPFYGYKGYYEDVVALYEQSGRELSAWEMHALGRAYSRWATELMQAYASSSAPVDSVVQPAARSAIDEDRIATFISLSDKAIAAYHTTMTLAPDFVTPIGPIKTKYANEVMHAFMSLLYGYDDTAARRVLRKDLYDPFLLQMGRNWLNTCLPNSVLFTYGDSDTYPLYYLQAVENLRTDVIIVNLSMMVLPRYLQMLYNGPMGAQPLQTRLPPRFFERISYCPVDEVGSTSSFLPIEALYLALSDTLRYEYSLLTPEMQTITLPSLSYRLQVPPGVAGFDGANVEEIIITNTDRHILSDRIFMLDLLEANAWRRPAYFAPTVDFSSYPDMADYLAWEGLLLRVYPRKLSDIHSSPFSNVVESPVHQERSVQLWTETYRFDTTEVTTGLDKKPFHQRALIGAFVLMKKLQDQGENERAIALGRQTITYFPDSKLPWDGLWTYIAKIMAKAGDPATAGQITLKVYDNCTQNRLTGYSEEEIAAIRNSACKLADEWNLKKVIQRCQGN